MPHLTLYYTANLDGFDPARALAAANQALANSGHFSESTIKSRAMRLDDFRIGTADTGRAFVHAVLKIMPGRSQGIRLALSRALLQALRGATHAPELHCQICVEVQELLADTYAKAVLDPDLPEPGA